MEIKFKVVLHDDLYFLEKEVTEMINKGWKVSGSLVVHTRKLSNGLLDTAYYQAMVKE